MSHKDDTIAAVCTAQGRAGVGIVRVSGAAVKKIILEVVKKTLNPRVATYVDFVDQDDVVLDCGLALFFPGPNSFTGEDVLELQGHGGNVVMANVLQRVLACGARHADPGEFSLRAFLNNKIDLVQAEAVAQLIDSGSKQAAKAAMGSLRGVFSKKIKILEEKIIALRVYVEAAIDFSEEEIDFLSNKKIILKLDCLQKEIKEILCEAEKGVVLADGIEAAIVGPPNAGKSSVFNYLCREDAAIVTPIPGTTRDVLTKQIVVGGVHFNLHDTAGLRETEDLVEQLGITRAWKAVSGAELILLVIDGSGDYNNYNPYVLFPDWIKKCPQGVKILIVVNKIDKINNKQNQKTKSMADPRYDVVFVSAKTGDGFIDFENKIKQMFGFSGPAPLFLARERHVLALQKVIFHIDKAVMQLETATAFDLVAEELSLAQAALGDVTGDFSSDQLLGEIFSKFCVGK